MTSPAVPHALLSLALDTLLLAVGTAVFLSQRKSHKRGEKLWNTTSRRLIINMAIPLVTGGLVVISLLSHDMAGLAAPFSLLFYGLALYGAGSFHTEPSNFWGSWKSCSVLSAHVLSVMGYFVGQSALARCILSMGFTSIIVTRSETSNRRTI